MEFEPAYGVAGSFTPDHLVNGTFPQVRKTADLVRNVGILKRGTVLARSKEDPKKLERVSKDAEPYGVLASDVDTSTVTFGVVYLTGQFDTRSLVLGDVSLEDVTEKLRNKSIFIS